MVLPLFCTQIVFLILFFQFTLLNRPKNACKRSFCNFFYLHTDEQGKTRSMFYWQSTFPPWPRGKGNCLPGCLHGLTLILGGSSTDGWRRLVDDPPKTEIKAGRGVQENTWQYREAKEANVICLVFLTNI